MYFVIEHSYLIPLLPLLGALVAGLLGAKVLKGRSHWPIWLGVGASAVLSLTLLVGMLGHEPFRGITGMTGGEHAGATPPINEQTKDAGIRTYSFTSHWFDWIVAGDDTGAKFNASAGAFIDPLTAVMLSVVCGIGFLITVFAAGYMKGEAGYFRFFAYLGLFIFSMTCLVMGDNLVMLYLGWEGVGVCSYLLVGYYYDKPSAREAAKKAFIVNRIGDFGFALGIFLVFYAFGTISYFGDGPGQAAKGFVEMALNVTQYVPQDRQWTLPLIPFCLMLGAFGKSAQFPLYVWLPDAMEGPTPVSALIHAATMVTAGVYMIARLGTLFIPHEAAMITIAVVGAFTALFAGSIALKQNDLKKVFAYSTVSQLGYMFVAVAVLNPVAAVFHLITHAFFKALLFLSSGVVMHATGGVLDLRKMSGMKKVLPKTNVLILVGCLALAGFPLFSGFWSKDEIVAASGHSSHLLEWVLLATSLLTAYYTFRLYFRVFQGPEVIPTGDHGHGHSHDAEEAHAHADHATDGHGHNHEPLVMMLPLAILAIGAVFVGVINLPFGIGVPAHALGHFLNQSPSFAFGLIAAKAEYPEVNPVGFGGHSSEAFSVVPLVIGGAISLIGIAIAYALHLQNRKKADQLAASPLGLIGNGMVHKYWIDELFQWTIVEPLRLLGRVLGAFDKWVIDGVVSLVACVPMVGGFAVKRTTQLGYLQGYALGMLTGVAVILLWVFA